jgi:SNF2 family DNA or RNA helicase
MSRLQLKPFQKADVMFMRKHNYRVLVANAPGTGKTIEVLAGISIDRIKLCPAVIICPASVVWNWHREARKWCPWARVHVVDDMSTPFPQKKHHIYIISWGLIVDRAFELLSLKPRLITADEAHMAKNAEAQRSQALYGLAMSSEHLLLLTGTPLVNKREELETLQSLFGVDNPPMIRRLLEDAVPDIPPKKRSLLPVYLPPKVAQQYRRAVQEFDRWLKEELASRMDAGEAEAAARRALAAEALVKVGYLRRIIGKGKVNAAADWAARAVRLGEPVVIFAEHGAVIKALSGNLRKQRLRHVVLTGATPKGERQRIIDQFQSGEVPIFIASKAGSTGITLTRAKHLCFVERFWTSADEEQAEDRIRRIGQTQPTRIWFLHAAGTVDDRISRIIERKRILIREAIGNEDIEQTPEKAVMEMIAEWSEHAKAPVHNGNAMLGLVKALPPLPKSKDVHQIIFKGKRWNEAAVRSWAKMNGYSLKSVRFDGRVWRATHHAVSLFLSGKFKSFTISKDIKILLGARRKKRPNRRGRTNRVPSRAPLFK